jgi:hypothetical protein
MLIDEFGGSVLIGHQLIPFFIVAMYFPVFILFDPISIFIMPHEQTPRHNRHQKPILIVSPDGSKSISFYSEAKLVIFVHLSGLGVLLQGEAILRVIHFILSLSVFTEVVALTINQHLLTVVIDDFIAIFVVLADVAILILDAYVAVLVDMLFFGWVSDHFESIFVVKYSLSVLFSYLIASLIVRFAIDELTTFSVKDQRFSVDDPHLIPILIVAFVVAVFIDFDPITVLVIEDHIAQGVVFDLVAVMVVLDWLPHSFFGGGGDVLVSF